MNSHSTQNKHAPKDRQRDKLARKQGRRDAYDRILIVSEGSKTEPNYFNEIRRFYRLHAANIQVCHSASGTSPLQVVEYARDLFLRGDPHTKIGARAFDTIYAVFDRDDHQNYFAALDLAKKLNENHKNDDKRAVQFFSIASIPCFELWLLLHFEDINAPLHRNDVSKRLKTHLPDYEKVMMTFLGVSILT